MAAGDTGDHNRRDDAESPGALTARQARFVEEYLVDLNATQAAIRAGYSARTADKIGSELLGKTRIAEAISDAQAARSERTQVTADQVIAELAAIGFAKLGDYAAWGPSRFELFESGAVDSRAVQEIKVKETVLAGGENGETVVRREYGIKLHDKLKALVKLGEHLGMWDARASATIDANVPGGVQIFLPDRKITA